VEENHPFNFNPVKYHQASPLSGVNLSIAIPHEQKFTDQRYAFSDVLGLPSLAVASLPIRIPIAEATEIMATSRCNIMVSRCYRVPAE
jgi:hypothetical protein